MSQLTRLLMTMSVPLLHDPSLLFTTAAPLQGPPIQARDAAGAQDNSDSFVPNFQDLSAVLSLLAADSVERRLVCSDSTQMWERCSSLWSIFGLVGLARVQLKIAVGLARSEKAGLELKGAEGFTAKKTLGSSNAWEIGSLTPGPWLDLNERFLGHAKALGSQWRGKPFVIVCAYSQCPPRGQRFRREVAEHCILTIFTLALASGPIYLLREGDVFLNNVAMSLILAGGFVGGCMLPFMLIYLNDVGIEHIASLSSKSVNSLGFMPLPSEEELPFPPSVIDRPSWHARHSSNFTSVSSTGLLALSNLASATHERDPQENKTGHSFDRLVNVGDTVISSPDRRLVMWRRPGSPIIRSADLKAVRVAAGISFIAIIAAYIINYILLGSVPVSATYYWIGIQVAILCGRYWLWSGERNFMHSRHRGLLYAVSSKLCHEAVPPLCPNTQPFTISADSMENSDSLQPVMDEDFIRFCVAAACSKLSNIGTSTESNSLAALSKLGGSAPRDILLAHVYTLRYISDAERDQFTLLRLPWATMEELYLAQGLILGQNPLAYAGLFMAAILRNGNFVGVTTVNPHQSEQSPRCRGLTMDGCEVWDSLVDAKLGGFTGVDEAMTQYHESFRENIQKCRNSSELNGPPHVELNAIYEGDYVEYRQVLPSVEVTLQKVEEIAEKAAQKTDHSDCKDNRCYFFGGLGRAF